MTDAFFPAEQLAIEWASKICNHLESIGITQEEVKETRVIIYTFTRIAAKELSDNPILKLPSTEQSIELNNTHIHQIIDLFLRGVNHSAKKLRNAGLDWQTRREYLEKLAWNLLNLAKLLVGIFHHPQPTLTIHDEKELQLMMKQHVETLFKEQVSGIKNPSLFRNKP